MWDRWLEVVLCELSAQKQSVRICDVRVGGAQCCGGGCMLPIVRAAVQHLQSGWADIKHASANPQANDKHVPDKSIKPTKVAKPL